MIKRTYIRQVVLPFLIKGKMIFLELQIVFQGFYSLVIDSSRIDTSGLLWQFLMDVLNNVLQLSGSISLYYISAKTIKNSSAKLFKTAHGLTKCI